MSKLDYKQMQNELKNFLKTYAYEFQKSGRGGETVTLHIVHTWEGDRHDMRECASKAEAKGAIKSLEKRGYHPCPLRHKGI